MKQLLVLSGKGGTGKTTVAAAFIKLSRAEAYADCDVDAPNLHIVIKSKSKPSRSDYYGMAKAFIDREKCIRCGQCEESCRFDAVDDFRVDAVSCEGCALCEAVCPVGAISMRPHIAGELLLYKDEDKVFSTAKLAMGSGNSGKLVSEVKKQIKNLDAKLAIIDGSPGIGCPVIASLSGADLVLIVAEPTQSGISDMERIIKTAGILQMKIAVCVNKYDINRSNTEKIENYCRINNVAFVGRIPFDTEAVHAVNSGMAITDIECAAGAAVKDLFENVIKLI